MRRLKSFWQVISQAALIVLAFALPNVHAQDGKAPAGKKAEQPTSKFLGMQRCASCHSPSETRKRVVSREFCLMNEVEIFEDEDKHAQAFDLLVAEDGLGQRMAKKLKIPKLSEAKECLSCHAGWSPQDTRNPSLELVESGVSCEACHGPSGDWDTPHSFPEWRSRPVDEKKKLGMTDVRDPVSRAKLCYSCHIGNVDMNRVVTHDMYAAGHPPLPSIEIETFIAVMPSHARKFQEKGDFAFRKQYATESRSGDAIGNLPRTKGVLVGGIVALSESLELFAKQTAKSNGPEFALFDCQACHHELRLPAWRQARANPGKPGRPRLPEWPTVLASIGIAQVEPNASALQGKLDDLAKAMSERPFGGSEKVQEIINGNGKPGQGLVSWLENKAQELAARPLSKKEADLAIKALYCLGATEDCDFHSARQIAWAIRAIEIESRLTYPSFPPREADLRRAARISREESDIKRWRDWRDTEKKASEDKATADLVELDKLLRLKLPAGQKMRIVEDNLEPFMKLSSGYDPKSFRAYFKNNAVQSGGGAAK